MLNDFLRYRLKGLFLTQIVPSVRKHNTDFFYYSARAEIPQKLRCFANEYSNLFLYVIARLEHITVWIFLFRHARAVLVLSE